MFKKLLIISLIFLLSIGIASAADNQTDASDVNVTGDNFGDIQEAVNDVADGGKINLDAKTYYPTENEIVDFSFIKINKSLNIVGEYNKTVITANDSMPVFYVEDADNVQIENIIFTRASPAVIITNSNVAFKNCQFNSNGFSIGAAIYINGGNINVTDCIFRDNIAMQESVSIGGAIAVMNANGYTINIVNSQFINNSAMRGGAIYVVGGDSKEGYVNINNSIFNLNNAIYDIEEEFAAGDISFYNIGDSQINVKMSIDNSSFISVDDPQLVDSIHPSLYLANNNNIIRNSNFTNYVMVLWNNVKMDFDNCNIENLEMYCNDKNHALNSGNNQLTVNNSNLKNAHLDSGAGWIENTKFDSNSGINIYANSFDIVNSTFTKDSYIVLNKGNLSVVHSDFADSTIEFGHMSDAILKTYLNLNNVEFKNNVKLDAKYSRTTFNNCKGLENIVLPVRFAYSSLVTYYKSGKSFSLKAICSNDNKAVGNLNFVLKIYKGNKLVKKYNLKTNKNGKVSFDASVLTPGFYAMQTVLSSKSYYFNDHVAYLSITKIKTTVKAAKVTAKYKKSKYFRVTVKNKATKKLVKNIKIKIKVFTGKKYKIHTVKTSKSGVAKINTKSLKRGTHKVVISSGNSYYEISAKSTIKIK